MKIGSNLNFINCPCGNCYLVYERNEHLISIRHIQWLNMQLKKLKKKVY